MYFDEEKSLTETECRIVNTSSCNQEMVVKPKNISVTECGIVEEVKCLNGMDTRVEEECKVINQRICAPTTEEVKVVTEVKSIVITIGFIKTQRFKNPSSRGDYFVATFGVNNMTIYITQFSFLVQVGPLDTCSFPSVADN